MSAFVSARQAAELCGVSEKTVRRWIAAGRLKADKHGREFQISLADLAPFGASTARPADPPDEPDDLASQPAIEVTVIPPSQSPRAEPAVSYLADIVRDLQADLTEKAEAAATWQSRAELLARELEELRRLMREQELELPPGELEPEAVGFRVPRWHPIVIAALAVVCVMALVALLDSVISQGLLFR
jgi:excisionase family DNA binding protein